MVGYMIVCITHINHNNRLLTLQMFVVFNFDEMVECENKFYFYHLLIFGHFVADIFGKITSSLLLKMLGGMALQSFFFGGLI